MSDIVLYKDQKLEAISGRELIGPDLLKKSLPRFFLASPVYVGKHNQAGFVIGDRTPDKRPFWIGSDILRLAPEEVEKMIQDYKKWGNGIPEEDRYFYDTKGSMAALRYFAISNTLNEILKRDEFLGPAMIRKICEQAAVPKEFHELPVYPVGCDTISEYGHDDCMERNGLNAVINQALAPLKQRTGSNYSSQSYVTYFPTVAYSVIVPTLEESVKGVVARFDEFGNRFGLLETHKELMRNPLLLE